MPDRNDFDPRGRSRPGRLILSVPIACVVILAGCSGIGPPSTSDLRPSGPLVLLRTEERPADACHAHPVRGTLVADEEHGVGLLIEGTVWEVVWPAGYTARRDPSGVVLLGPDVVAQEGDEIVSAGAGLTSGDGLAHPCGKVMVFKRAGSQAPAE